MGTPQQQTHFSILESASNLILHRPSPSQLESWPQNNCTRSFPSAASAAAAACFDAIALAKQVCG
jgi:hypothetical protein